MEGEEVTQGRHSGEVEAEMVRGDSSLRPPGEPSDAGLLSPDLQSSDEFVEADWTASRPSHSKINRQQSSHFKTRKRKQMLVFRCH